jgi:transcriptional regulator of acetoin/glycerol metabolism
MDKNIEEQQKKKKLIQWYPVDRDNSLKKATEDTKELFDAFQIIEGAGLINWVLEDTGFYTQLSGNETLFEYMAMIDRIRHGVLTGQISSEKTKKLIRYAKSNSPIIILGESGTGKELLANAIHQLSNRKDAPFVPINSAELSESLFESEMFGHKKGAFTGATYLKKGLLQSANKGTFFLDELGKMPVVLQAKLLRIIENKKVRMVGEEKSNEIDVRFLVAMQEQEIGKVLDDLRSRLRFPDVLRMPSLNKQLKKYGRNIIYSSLNKVMKESNFPKNERVIFSDELMEFLVGYNYKLNYRELENILHHLMLNRDPNSMGYLTMSCFSDIEDLLQNYHSNIADTSISDKKHPALHLSTVLTEDRYLEPIFIKNDAVLMRLDYENIKYAEIDSLIKKFGSLIAKGTVMHIHNKGIDFKKAFSLSKANVGYEGYMQKISRILGMNANAFVKEYAKEHSGLISQLPVKGLNLNEEASDE